MSGQALKLSALLLAFSVCAKPDMPPASENPFQRLDMIVNVPPSLEGRFPISLSLEQVRQLPNEELSNRFFMLHALAHSLITKDTSLIGDLPAAEEDIKLHYLEQYVQARRELELRTNSTIQAQWDEVIFDKDGKINPPKASPKPSVRELII